MTPSDPEKTLRRFATAVYEPNDIVEVRRLPSRQSSWHRADCIPVTALLQENRRGENVYVGVNPRRARGTGVRARDCTGERPCGRCADCVAVARCLFVDFDGIGIAEARHRLGDADLPGPTVLIESGGGVHAYWRLDNPIADLALWAGHQRSLIQAVGSDPAVHDAPRIMRLPGSANLKYRPPRPCRIVECDPERTYPIDEFPDPKIEAVRNAIAPADIEAFQASGQIETPCRKTLAFIAGGAAKGHRRTSLHVAACDLCGCGWLESQAVAVLMPRAKLLRQADENLDEWRTRCLEQIQNAYAKPRLPAGRIGRSRIPTERYATRGQRPRQTYHYTIRG